MKLTIALLVLLAPVLLASASPSSPLTDKRKHDSSGVEVNGGLHSNGNAGGSNSHLVRRETGEVTTDWYRYWAPPIKDIGLICIDNSIRSGGGKPLYWCIREGEALCIVYSHRQFGGKWTFGIKDGMAKLWNPKMEVVWEFCGKVTHICIGEDHGYDPNHYSTERPFLQFYNEMTNEVVGSLKCDGTDGKNDKNIGESTILKLVDNSDLGQHVPYPITVVKFRKGMTEDHEDDNSLWKIAFNPTDPKRLWWDSTQDYEATFMYNQDKCEWTDLCPSNVPSSIPSAIPSDDPTLMPSPAPVICRNETMDGGRFLRLGNKRLLQEDEVPVCNACSEISTCNTTDVAFGAVCCIPLQSEDPTEPITLLELCVPTDRVDDALSLNGQCGPCPDGCPAGSDIIACTSDVNGEEGILMCVKEAFTTTAANTVCVPLDLVNEALDAGATCGDCGESCPSPIPSTMPSLSNKPSGTPSGLPSDAPSRRPSKMPSNVPSSEPTAFPNLQPSSIPSKGPSILPSLDPSATRSGAPSRFPSPSPSDQSSLSPSDVPSSKPSSHPSNIPSSGPSSDPSSSPSSDPSSDPSFQPSGNPSSSHRPSEAIASDEPSGQPSVSSVPSSDPSSAPSVQPSESPTASPSSSPSTNPSESPSSIPSGEPSIAPSSVPSTHPSGQPSNIPSVQPSHFPSSAPSLGPSSQPSESSSPSSMPTPIASGSPSDMPSLTPSISPSSGPSGTPSSKPSLESSFSLSSRPSPVLVLPTPKPSSTPSNGPSSSPSLTASAVPSVAPSILPSSLPSLTASNVPSSFPTATPSSACVPTPNTCCEDADCTDPAGAICVDGTCECRLCEEEITVGGEKVCQLKCACLNDCNNSTGDCNDDPEVNCDKCDENDDCNDGESCDGDFCVPSGVCTERKNQLCDNAYFLVTGSSDQRAKCCPDTSGCVKDELMLPENSVCSTTCGECLGTINGQDPLEPKVFCVFEESDWSEEIGLKNCYEDITKPLCENVTAPPLDVGEDRCSSESPPVEGGSAGCEVNGSGEVIGPGLVCCEPPFLTQQTCDVGGASFASYRTDRFNVLLLAQCRPEEVTV